MKVRDVIKKIEQQAAYAPDLLGLGVVADTPEEAERLIREGIGIYIDELRERGDAIPEPVSQTRRIAIAV